MKVFFVILGLICAAQSSFVRQASRPCEELADALLDLLNGPEVQAAAQHGFNINQMILWSTSIDVSDRARVVDVVCNVAGVDAASAIGYLDRTGILEAVTRRGYDMFVVQLEQARTMLQYLSQMGGQGAGPMGGRQVAQLTLDIIDQLEQMGFLSLDPEGVTEAQGYAGLMNPGPGGPGGRGMQARATEDCDRLKQLVGQMLSMASSQPDFGQFAVRYSAMTGQSILDREAVGAFLCDVAESNSIRDIVDAHRERGVYTRMMEFGLRLLKAHGPTMLLLHEQYETMTDEQLAMIVGEGMVGRVRASQTTALRALRAMRQLDMI